MPLPPGTRLGPCEIGDLLGAAGMGEVYEARDVRLERKVAVKILPPELAAEPQFLEWFDREAGRGAVAGQAGYDRPLPPRRAAIAWWKPQPMPSAAATRPTGRAAPRPG